MEQGEQGNNDNNGNTNMFTINIMNTNENMEPRRKRRSVLKKGSWLYGTIENSIVSNLTHDMVEFVVKRLSVANYNFWDELRDMNLCLIECIINISLMRINNNHATALRIGRREYQENVFFTSLLISSLGTLMSIKPWQMEKLTSTSNIKWWINNTIKKEDVICKSVCRVVMPYFVKNI